MLRLSRTLCAAVLLSAAIVPCWALAAPHPTVQVRPLNREHTRAMTTGSIQAEAGYAFEQAADNTESQALPLRVRMQLMEALDLHVGWQVLSHRGEGKNRAALTGVGDLTVGSRILFSQPAGLTPGTGLLLRLTAPTASDDSLSIAHAQYEAAFLLGLCVFDLVDLDLQAGISAQPRPRAHTVLDLPVHFAVGAELFGFVEFFAELSAVIDLRNDTRTSRSSSGFGLSFEVLDNISLDAGVQVGISPQAPAFGVAVGLSWNFVDLY